jgi:hypothetical protein
VIRPCETCIGTPHCRSDPEVLSGLIERACGSSDCAAWFRRPRARIVVPTTTARHQRQRPGLWGETGSSWGGNRLGDRTDAEHREGGREILRHRREGGRGES